MDRPLKTLPQELNVKEAGFTCSSRSDAGVCSIKWNETPAIIMTTDADLAVHTSGGLERILHISLDDAKSAATRYFVQDRASLLNEKSHQWC